MRRHPHSIVAKFWRNERGAALVEMAIITPLVISLAAGVFEFSNILHTKLLIESGIEDGARYIARCSGPDETTCNTRGANLAANGSVTGGTARVPNWLPADVAVVYLPVAALDADGVRLYRSDGLNVRVVQVSTSYNYTGTGLWDILGLGAMQLAVAHQERVMGW
jgi:Flp pilus assembly protein TadG